MQTKLDRSINNRLNACVPFLLRIHRLKLSKYIRNSFLPLLSKINFEQISHFIIIEIHNFFAWFQQHHCSHLNFSHCRVCSHGCCPGKKKHLMSVLRRYVWMVPPRTRPHILRIEFHNFKGSGGMHSFSDHGSGYWCRIWAIGSSDFASECLQKWSLDTNTNPPGPSLGQTFKDQGAFGVSTLMVVQVPGSMKWFRPNEIELQRNQ